MADESTVALRAILKDEVTKSVKTIQDAINAMGKAGVSATQPWDDETKKLTESLNDNILRLRAQKEILQDPVYKQSAAQAAKLRSEINEMTRSLVQSDSTERGIFSNMRTRREALVMAHEAMMGRTKNLMGSAMVFAEYADLDIMKTVTSMITPVTVGVGLASVAVVGLGVELVRLSEKAAENYHQMELLGAQSGSTAEEIIALQHAAIGTEVSTKTLADSFGKFTLRLGEHRAELAKVGVTARDPKEAFAQLMDVVAGTSDASERNRIMNLALGESWKQLAPFVLKGGDAFRQALEEMQIPDSTKKRYEEINALQEESAKNWDVIKNRASGAAAGILSNLDRIKLGFSELAKTKGLATAIGNVGIANVSYLWQVGNKALEEEQRKQKTPGNAPQGPSEELLKARAEWEKTFRKDSLADALKDEDKRWKEERAIQGAGHADIEAADRAHRMRMADIRKSFERKDHKAKTTDPVANELDSREKVIAGERAYQESLSRLTEDGVNKQVSIVSAGADKQIAEVVAGYAKMRSAKGVTRSDLVRIERDQRAEIENIENKSAEKIQAIYTKEHNDDVIKKAKDYHNDQEYLQKRQNEVKEASKKIAEINISSSKELPGTVGKKDSSKYDLERQAIDQSAAERKRSIASEIKDEKQKAAALQAIEANSAVQKAKVDRAELEERKKNYEKYSAHVESYAQSQLSSLLQGEFTLTKAKEAAKDAAINFIAEEATKRMAKWVESLVFEKSESAVANAESIAQAQITGAMLAESYATAAAWASIMTMGVADVAGATGMATTLAAAKSASVGGFAGGGVQFGSAYTGERGPEISTPTVPRRITQTTNSTVNNSYGGATVIINTGASVDRVAAVAVRATTRQARGMVRSSR